MKTIEQKLEDSKNYISNSAQHLFVINDTIIMKIIPFKVDGIQYVGKLRIIKGVASLTAFKVDGFMKWDLSNSLFPKYVKTNSIPYFKKMREIVSVIEAEIKMKDNETLIEKIKERVSEIQLMKEEE